MGLPACIVRGEKPAERFARRNGFNFTRHNDYSLTIEFEGRFVQVAYAGDSLMCFRCTCKARWPAYCMVAVPMTLLLARNNETLFANWQIAVENGYVIARVHYSALTQHMDDLLFKVICHDLINEVALVERILQSQGLLAD